MAALVTSPLERQLGQMPGLTQMTSSSSGGSSLITLQFDLDLPLDVAEQEVQAAINAATSLLRSEEHTSELQSLMRISYAVFCLKKKNKNKIIKMDKHHSDVSVL